MKKISWYLQESNQGHKDFQSFALPTELRYQLFHFYGCKSNTFFETCKIFREYFVSFLSIFL